MRQGQLLFLLATLVSAACVVEPEPDSIPDSNEPDGTEQEDSWFTLLVLPDIQYLSLNPQYGMLPAMMNWILEHADELNIAMVLQEGDITHNNTEAEWVAADEAFDMLDGHVPYSVCVGNHDMDNSAGDRDTAQYNTWFGLERWEQTETFYGSASAASADDHAHVFSAGGVDWMVLSLAYDPTDEALAWGAQLVEEHPESRVIVLTHAYLTPNANTSSEGAGIEAQIVDPYPNVDLVLNGHFTGGFNADRRRTRDDGTDVVEVFANYQTLLQGAGGRMRQMRLDPAAGTLDVTSCNAFDVCSDDEGDVFGMEGLGFGL